MNSRNPSTQKRIRLYALYVSKEWFTVRIETGTHTEILKIFNLHNVYMLSSKPGIILILFEFDKNRQECLRDMREHYMKVFVDDTEYYISYKEYEEHYRKIEEVKMKYGI